MKEKELRTRPDEVNKDLPERMAIITLNPFTSAVSFGKYGDAFLQIIKPDKIGSFNISNNSLYEKGTFQILTDKDIDNITSTDYEKFDLSLLRMLYSIILKEYEKKEFKIQNCQITLYAPDLFRALGKKGNQSKEQVLELVKQINNFNNVLGVVISNNGNNKSKSYYSLINFNFYDEEKNIISFSTPYLECVVRKVHEAAIRRDKKDKPVVSSTGQIKVKASHSYLIKPDIGKERNKAAVENVNIIVTLIEQAGNRNAHISAKTIVDRNELLKQRLEECSPRVRQQIINRTFKATWELLHSMTYLEETYKNIILPNPDDRSMIPKISQLSKTVYEFPHLGKNKCSNKDKQ